MKKLLLILLCVPLFGLGQSSSEIFEQMMLNKNRSCDELKLVQGMMYVKRSMTLFSGNVWCDEIHTHYYQGVKHGEYWSEFTNGIYNNGKKDGEWTTYYQDGQLISKGKYSNGERIGTWEYYDVSGNPVDSDDFDVTHPHVFRPPAKEEKSKMMDFLDTYKYPLLICLVLILLIYLIGRSTSNDKEIDNNQNRQNKETEHDQYKKSKNSNLSIEKLECNNSNDIERQYNTYIRRFRRRIYTKKMFSNKIDILNKEIEKLKRLNKIPKDYPLIDILDEINCF